MSALAEPIARAALRVTPHPLLPWLAPEEELALADLPGGLEELAKLHNERERRIRDATEDGDPFRWGFELDHWGEADTELKRVKSGQYISGGKRATKSERAAKRVVQAAMFLPKAKIWCLQGDITTSIATQQQLIWKYLPKEIKKLNGRGRRGVAKINYSIDGGFTERVLVLPNRSSIFFLTFNQEPKDYQGWAIGSAEHDKVEELCRRHPWLHNLGAWADEDMPLDWFTTITERCTTTGAKWLWTFTTLSGITTTIKQVLGTPRTIKSRRAELLAAEVKHVEDCPPGEMPYVVEPSTPGVSVMYFHTDLNPFPPNYENMKALYGHRSSDVIKNNLYGYARDTLNRAWPLFGAWNIVKPEHLPAVGTNYMVMDPAGSRNWATIWVRVAPGNPRKLYVYRDWPPAQEYGEWAVPSSDPHQPDGDMGPAQRSFGWGYAQYKNEWLRRERIVPLVRLGHVIERDPYRQGMVEQAVTALKAKGVEGETLNSQLSTLNFQELIRDRLIDPRAGKSPHATEKGGTCIMDELARENREPNTGRLIAPRMFFYAAPGLNLDKEGIPAVNALLYWDTEEPLTPQLNEPHLYVSEECQQVIWCLENYTARGGESGGTKDMADLLRYMATADLRHADPAAVRSVGGGSY